MGNKVNPNLLRLTNNSNNYKSFWSINEIKQYKSFVYQDFIIRKYINFLFEELFNLPLGTIEIYRDSNNNLKIIIPFCNVSSLMLRKNFSQKKIFKILDNDKKKTFQKNFKNINKEKIQVKENYINFVSMMLEYKIKSFTKSTNVEIVLKNFYNKTTRHFFFNFWKQNRQLENRFKKHSFYKNFNMHLSFALQQKSPEIISNFCIKQLEHVPNGKHHLVLNILQACLPIYLSIVPNILGLKIQVSGNLQGSERKRKRILQIGQIPLQTISSNVKYSFQPALTKFGSIGVKVWLYTKEDLYSENYLYSSFKNKNLNAKISISNIFQTIKNI